MLGKRKRRADLVRQQDENDVATDANEEYLKYVQKHFEAQFAPLPARVTLKSRTPDVILQAGSEDEAWSGISDEETASKNTYQHVTVIEHTTVSRAELSKEEKKRFMSSKPPLEAPKALLKPNKVDNSRESTTEASLLKKDLALQRLLQESHLLQHSSASTPDLTLDAKARQKALDQRMQALGSKTSILKQEKMPLAIRKGIEAKTAGKAYERRREAKENGIILERSGGAQRIRKKGVAEIGAPSVGKFKGGTLKLSKKDVMSIQGSGGAKRGRGKRR